MIPDFVPREILRLYLNANTLNKYIRIDGLTVHGYLAKLERMGKPLRCKIHNGSRKWRMIDVIAHAKANCLNISPPFEKEIKKTIDELILEKEMLENEINGLKHSLAHDEISKKLTGHRLLRHNEIVDGKISVPECSGVYFLIQLNKVVYVGQARNVYNRVSQHINTKSFDSFSYIHCNIDSLDILESLYIHFLQPESNGKFTNGEGFCAPLSMEKLMQFMKNVA